MTPPALVPPGEAPAAGVEVGSETDGRRRIARDEYGWVRGIRWAVGRGGAHCRDADHAESDYLGPNPAFGQVSQQERESRRHPAEVRTCGMCLPRAAASRERRAA